ncbi:MAG: nitrite/sulfite reductase [Lentisphaeria bacterium]|nr:MAG: nitrite/sulfite reductase [Lentisphaeria bacterium]
MNLEHIIEAQSGLIDALGKFAAGELEPAAFKPFGAPFGVYQQRNGEFMNRIRLVGGEIPMNKLRFLRDLVRESGAKFAHISTRQNIQLHDVSPLNSIEVIRRCTANGLPFRGGGGDTFRNIAITAASGVAADGSFDLAPYARFLTEAVFDWDIAFHLPRKIKIGFSTKEDAALALRQDLGFVAATDETGRRGFAVYGGGGFGRESTTGVQLFDFLPAEKIVPAARAMVELFSEHGDRTNRNRARIRFIVKRLGETEFIRLYHEYYNKIDAGAYPVPPEFPADWAYGKTVNPFDADNSLEADPEFAAWRKIAVAPTRFGADVVMVTLFVPRGVLSPEEFAAMTGVIEEFGLPAIRLTFEQNVILPALHVSALPHLYRALRKLPFDLCFSTFAGQLDCCIGATVCKIGVLDTPKYGALVAEALDRYFAEHPEKKPVLATKLIEMLHFSGCPNSCTAHEVSRFGFQGCRKNIDGVLTDCFQLWRNPEFPVSAIGGAADEVIPAAKIGERVISLLEEEHLLD